MKYSLVVFVLLLCIGCQTKNETPQRIDLDSNWQFKNTKDSIWMDATIPGNVHSDLLDHKLIEDPFIGTNELKLQWISKSDWEYKTNFSLDDETLQKNNVELRFSGLDTYAQVFLNDSLILIANNAFRQWHVNIMSIVKKENRLRIVFENTSKFETREKEKLDYLLPDGDRVFTRKAQFQYGWDWGPKLNTSGVWKPITLCAWNDLKIETVFIKQERLNDSIAKLMAHLNIKSALNEEVTIDVFVNDTLNTTQVTKVNERLTFIPFKINRPKLWWPHNLGTPYQYNLKFVVRQGKTVLDSFQLKKGLRTVELITEKDTIGESFYFKVNSIPVYMKGANYIPQNSLQNKVTDTHYNTLLNDVVDANMNMLRVWGGGMYENDIFYDLCDEKGILVWQDFMFACSMYPGDSLFLENIQQEAIDNVKRLRNHASIALWCGNNENSEGWHRWGWQVDKTDVQKTQIWDDYLKVFDSILPKTVNEHTDNTSYWESTPKYGRGNPKYKTEGDAHDWWVWHDGYPFEHLEANVPRFMSEFGFQSFPSYEIIKYINGSDSIQLSTDAIKAHQKHSRGFQLIRSYMARDFPEPNNDEDYVYVSQVLQAYGIVKGIEAHRRAKPYNMGSLYWQLNDCWPSVSWSSIDYFGNWKALHYKAKQAFKNVLITSKVENNTLKTYVVNDDLKSLYGQLSVQILDFSGQVIYQDSKTVEVASSSSELKHELRLDGIQINKKEVVVVLKFNNETSLFYLVKPKDLNLEAQTIQKKIIKTEKGFQIELSGKTLQKDVFLFCNELGHFSDNYFDLLPYQTKTIEFVTKSNTLDHLSVKTFNSLIR